MDRNTWHAVVHEVTKSQTRLSDWTELKLWPTLWDSMDCSPPGSSVHAISQPRTHNGAGCHFLLQGIFLSQESSPHLPHWQVDSLPLSYSGSLHFIVAILWKTISCAKIVDFPSLISPLPLCLFKRSQHHSSNNKYLLFYKGTMLQDWGLKIVHGSISHCV